MGLNPGGDEEVHRHLTIRNSLENRCWQYSAYEAEQWEWGGSILEAGQHPHQQRVWSLCDH
jgi:hypothetical protein